MRRLALILLGSAVWLFLLAIPVLADNGPHQAGAYVGTTTDFCAGCHRTHSAAASNLLMKSQPGLCYTCHGAVAQGAQTDVQNGAFFSTNGARSNPTGTTGIPALRGGGFDYSLIASNAWTGPAGNSLISGNSAIAALSTGAVTTSHHSVDGSAQTMWGNGPISGSPNSGKAGVELTCGSCHDPHGNHQYRILKPGPGESGIPNFSFEAGYANGGRVFINDAGTKTYLTTNYGVIDAGNTSSVNNIPTGATVGQNWDGGPNDGSQVAYNATTKNWFGRYTETSSRWCATCHTRYFGASGAGTRDSGDAVFSFTHAEFNLVEPGNTGSVPTGAGWLSASLASPFAPITTVSGNLGTGSLIGSHGPKCLTCHVGHGSNAAMTTLITQQSSPGLGQVPAPYLNSTLLRLDNRGVCENCHSK